MSTDEGAVRIRIADVQAATAAAFGLPDTIMRCPRGGGGVTGAAALARQLAMALAVEMTHRTLPDIGPYFGCDHSGIARARDRIAVRLRASPDLRATAARIRTEAALRAIDFHNEMRRCADETRAAVAALPQANQGRSA
jgi:chromosomal replication initiation ATPase DnaA